MEEVVIEIWVPVVTAAIIAFFSWIGVMLKTAQRERREAASAQAAHNELSVQADLASLSDRLKFLCKHYEKTEFCSMGDKENLTLLFEAYSALGGNGNIKLAYERVMALPLAPCQFSALSERIKL